MFYLRLINDTFGFINSDVNAVQDTDIAITESDYNRFFELQSQGKQFRLKAEQPETGGLFDYVEEYEPEPLPEPKTEMELLEEKVELLDGTLTEVLFNIIPTLQGGA